MKVQEEANDTNKKKIKTFILAKKTLIDPNKPTQLVPNSNVTSEL